MSAFSDVNIDLSEAIRISISSNAPVPEHIAIIPDGNRRWAKSRGMPSMMGHWEGAEVLTDVVRAASDIGVKTVTVYAFSTENWGRPDEEVEALMDLFELYLVRKKDQMILDGVRLDAIGDLGKLPQKVMKTLQETKKATERCSKINLVLAINYGGRDEIRRAMGKILDLGIQPNQLTEELISSQLDTARYGDPQLLIRTSGELRVSNFLLWQISYAEIYSTEVLWPDFCRKDFFEAVSSYQSRKIRKGG